MTTTETGANWIIEAIKSVGFPIVIAGVMIWLLRDVQLNSDLRTKGQQEFMKSQIEASKKVSDEMATVVNENTKSNMELAHAVEEISEATEKHTIAIRSLEMEIHRGGISNGNSSPPPLRN